jgi:hypothetical protein
VRGLYSLASPVAWMDVLACDVAQEGQRTYSQRYKVAQRREDVFLLGVETELCGKDHCGVCNPKIYIGRD